MPLIVKEPTEREREKLIAEIEVLLRLFPKRLLTMLLASYMAHYNTIDWKEILQEAGVKID